MSNASEIKQKNADRITQIKGKMDCLTTLKERPETKDPEVKVITHHLSGFLRALVELYGKKKPEDKDKFKEIKKRIKLCLKACQFLEDILIRVVLGGETLEKALKRAEPWSDPNFEYKCKCKGKFYECNYVVAL